MLEISSRERYKSYFTKLKILTIPPLFTYSYLLFARTNICDFETQSDIHNYLCRNNSALKIPYNRLT